MNLRNFSIIATVVYVASLLFMACSSCAPSNHAARSTISQILVEGSEVGLEYVDNPDVSSEPDIQIDSPLPVDICPLGNSSGCFLDRSISEFIDLPICMNGTLLPIDVTESVDSSLYSAHISMLMCPSFQGIEDSSPYDILITSLEDIVFSVVEVHLFDSVEDLAVSMLTLRTLYNSSCEIAEDFPAPGDSFYCEINNKSIFVSISASSEAEQHVMVINFISDAKAFSDTLAYFE